MTAAFLSERHRQRVPLGVPRMTPKHEPPILDYEQAWRAHTTNVAFDIRQLDDAELLAAMDDLEEEYLMAQADLERRDFTFHPEHVLQNAEALAHVQLQEAITETQRRARARTLFATTGRDVATVMEPRWHAVRSLDLVDALQTLGVPLRKRGRDWWASCPFHEERTPSFSVTQEKGTWYCFSCQAGGDLITFIELREHVSRGGALRFAEAFLLGQAA